MSTEPLTIIGVASLDVTWNPHGESKMRLGGVAHASRALWALGIPHHVYYFAPEYLCEQTDDYLRRHGAINTAPIGTITGAPAVMLIGSPKETDVQKYEFLMRETLRFQFSADGLRCLGDQASADILILGAEFDAEPIFDQLGDRRRIHIDVANMPRPHVPRQVATILTSTSSTYFQSDTENTPATFAAAFVPNLAETVIVKENRGGSRAFGRSGTFSIGAQLRPIAHSVGVGDCYDATFVAFQRVLEVCDAATLASWAAAEYAATTDLDLFRAQVEWLARATVYELPKGTVVPWECRPKFQIYIAAPDFDYVDRQHIDAVHNALTYHNFSSRRPILENGQVSAVTPRMERLRIHFADLELLRSCHCVVAVNIGSDPGTYVEIGRAAAAGVPVVIFDPEQTADNLMLVESANAVVANLDALLLEIFQLACRWHEDETRR